MTKLNVRAALLFCICLLTAALAHGQQTTSTTPNTKPGAEGVTVHGYWKIDVKNPDGTVVDRREFENALQSPGMGDSLLSQLLTGRAVVGDIGIGFGGNTSCSFIPLAPLPPSPLHVACGIITGTSGPSSNLTNGQCSSGFSGNYFCNRGLTATYSAPTNTSPASILLQGSLTFPTGGAITSVTTWTGICLQTTGNYAETVTPNSCSTSGGGADSSTIATPLFTGTTLPAAGVTILNPTSGQIVQVSVTLSFS